MSVNGIQGKSNLITMPLRSEASAHLLRRAAKDPSTESEDVISISRKTQEFLRIRKIVDAQPDFRMAKVNTLAKAIQEGTYDIKGEMIADAIVRRNLIDLKA